VTADGDACKEDGKTRWTTRLSGSSTQDGGSASSPTAPTLNTKNRSSHASLVTSEEHDAFDIGCGEGQVARRIAALGAAVVGLDPTPSQITVARDRAGGPHYARARGEALPCRSAAFDAVLLCLAIEHIDAFENAISEVARVLEPGGRFVLLLCHPLLQAPGSGWIDDQIVGEHYWRIGTYLRDDTVIDNIANGVDLAFIHRPLSRYVPAMGQAGLLIDDMEEPSPPEKFLAETWGYAEAATIPRILLLRASRHP
jgi:SAM-dependent methyltransferase